MRSNEGKILKDNLIISLEENVIGIKNMLLLLLIQLVSFLIIRGLFPWHNKIVTKIRVTENKIENLYQIKYLEN